MPEATDALYEISAVFCGKVINVPLERISAEMPIASLPITRHNGILYETVAALSPDSGTARYSA